MRWRVSSNAPIACTPPEEAPAIEPHWKVNSCCDGVVPGGDRADKGVYHNTLTGSYIMTSEDGTVVIGEGQFALHKKGQAPQILKDDPGFKLNELPFVIGQSFNKSNAENCVVK